MTPLKTVIHLTLLSLLVFKAAAKPKPNAEAGFPFGNYNPFVNYNPYVNSNPYVNPFGNNNPYSFSNSFNLFNPFGR